MIWREGPSLRLWWNACFDFHHQGLKLCPVSWNVPQISRAIAAKLTQSQHQVGPVTVTGRATPRWNRHGYERPFPNLNIKHQVSILQHRAFHCSCGAGGRTHTSIVANNVRWKQQHLCQRWRIVDEYFCSGAHKTSQRLYRSSLEPRTEWGEKRERLHLNSRHWARPI